MDKELTQSANGARLKRDLSRDAISLALKGEWGARRGREPKPFWSCSQVTWKR